MFQNHFYTFGGKIFHQVQGGPIGLRGTCAIARVIMQLFDDKWGRRLENLGIRAWLRIRYVDDTRAILQPIKAGWRWVDGSLKYSKRWESEDMDIPGVKRTMDVILGTMSGIEQYLEFTGETGLDFEGGWLPTLDTSLMVGKDNKVLYKFFEKETATNKTVQRDSAMEKNTKLQIIAQDLVRRLLNTMESLGSQERMKVVDGYAQKLLNSGYEMEQVRKILVSGIKGYENRSGTTKKDGR